MHLKTTYIITGKKQGQITIKFDINGNLIHFDYDGELLSDVQTKWLYPRIPLNESKMSEWYKVKEFVVQKGEPDLSFETFWTIWNLKVKKENSEKAWNKLSKADKIKCFLNHKKYQEHLNRTGQAKAHLVTWLNQKRYNDEY